MWGFRLYEVFCKAKTRILLVLGVLGSVKWVFWGIEEFKWFLAGLNWTKVGPGWW
jgi:hypothetical protein